jgi:hypothetical protein
MQVDVVVWLRSLLGLIAAGWLGSSEVEVQGKNIHARVASVASCILAEHWPVTCSRDGPSVNVIASHTPRCCTLYEPHYPIKQLPTYPLNGKGRWVEVIAMFMLLDLMVRMVLPHFEDRFLCNPCMIPLSTTFVLPRTTSYSRDVTEDGNWSSSCLAMFWQRCARPPSIVVDLGIGNERRVNVHQR